MRLAIILVLLGALFVPRTAPAQAGDGCGTARAPGTTLHAIDVGGRSREYLRVVPDGYDARTALPVVLTFHGSGSSPERQLEISALATAAAARGFVVVAPYAARPMPDGGFTWNVPPAPEHADDVAFVAALIDALSASLCIDPARVYASGFSGGARLSSTLGCELADRIAAIGTVGGLRWPDACSPARALPVVAFHGTADRVNPYAGGGPAYWDHSVDAAFAGWVESAGGGAPDISIAGDVMRHTAAGDTVVLYSLDGVGHVWPAGDPIDTTQLMLDFFARHRL